MRARDVVILAGFLTFYDLTSTWLLPVTNDMMQRLGGLPLSPMFGWTVGGSGIGRGGGIAIWVGIGLGDLLLASIFPLVMHNAFGHVAGWAAMVVAMGAICAIILVHIPDIFPVMIVLGPLMIVQYIYWTRRRGSERATRQYLQAEPLLRKRPEPT